MCCWGAAWPEEPTTKPGDGLTGLCLWLARLEPFTLVSKAIVDGSRSMGMGAERLAAAPGAMTFNAWFR